MKLLDRCRSAVRGFVKGLRAASRVAVGLRYALSQGTPGSWANDHREETNQFTGWNYIAIHAQAQQAQQADVTVYADGKAVDKHTLRKSLRRRGLSKAYVDQTTESTPLGPDHPLARLMKKPNPTQSGASFRYEIIVQLRLTGTALIWRVRNSLGRTLELYVIPTAATTPVIPIAEFPRGGWRVQPNMVKLATSSDPQGFVEMGSLQYAVGGIIPAEDMIVVRRPHPLWKDDGYSAVAAGAMFTDTAKQIDEARWHGMKNGADPSIVVALDETFSLSQEELDAAQEKFNEKFADTRNKKKALFTTGGATITPLTTNPKDMDYVQTFTQYRETVFGLHGTPGIAAGFFPPNGTYGALAATLRGWGHLGVQPELDLVGEELTAQLSPEFGEGLSIELQHASIEDPELLEKQLDTDIKAGIRTKGEMRALRGLPPFGDERDDEIAGPAKPPAPLDETEQDAKDSPAPGLKKHLNGHSHNGNGHHTRRAALLAALQEEDEYP